MRYRRADGSRYLLILAQLSLGLTLSRLFATAEVESHLGMMPSVTIGIAGGTGAGKSTLARRVYQELGEGLNVTYLMHDNYYKDLSHLTIEERAKTVNSTSSIIVNISFDQNAQPTPK